MTTKFQGNLLERERIYSGMLFDFMALCLGNGAKYSLTHNYSLIRIIMGLLTPKSITFTELETWNAKTTTGYAITRSATVDLYWPSLYLSSRSNIVEFVMCSLHRPKLHFEFVSTFFLVPKKSKTCICIALMRHNTIKAYTCLYFSVAQHHRLTGTHCILTEG